MNKQLEEDAKEIWDREDRWNTQFFLTGNFTVCVITNLERNDIASVGVAKRNPSCDKENIKRGEEIAFYRAVKGMYTWEEETSDLEL